MFGFSLLKVDRIQEKTGVLGPGIRAVIWFHGCFRHCPGCIAAGMNKSQDFTEYTVDELFQKVASVEGIEGLTISGGEPLMQDLDELYEFLMLVRQKTALSVMLYTGYLLQEINEDENKKRLLDFVDILVDGPYVEELDHGQLWRGSENQRVYFLSSRYSEAQDSFAQKKGRPIECKFINASDFSLTGVPPRGFRESLSRRMAEKGLIINW